MPLTEIVTSGCDGAGVSGVTELRRVMVDGVVVIGSVVVGLGREGTVAATTVTALAGLFAVVARIVVRLTEDEAALALVGGFKFEMGLGAGCIGIGSGCVVSTGGGVVEVVGGVGGVVGGVGGVVGGVAGGVGGVV